MLEVLTSEANEKIANYITNIFSKELDEKFKLDLISSLLEYSGKPTEENQLKIIDISPDTFTLIQNPSHRVKAFAVSCDGMLLKDMSADDYNSNVIVTNALFQNGEAIQYLDKEKLTEALCREAIQSTYKAMKYLDKETIDNLLLITKKEAVVQYPGVMLQFLGSQDTSLQLLSVITDPSSIYCLENPPEEVQQMLVVIDPSFLKKLENPSIETIAIATELDIIPFTESRYIDNEKMAKISELFQIEKPDYLPNPYLDGIRAKILKIQDKREEIIKDTATSLCLQNRIKFLNSVDVDEKIIHEINEKCLDTDEIDMNRLDKMYEDEIKTEIKKNTHKNRF